MNSFQLAWLNLSRKALPSLMALFAIAISVGCGGILLRLFTLSSARFAELAPGGDAVVGPKSSGIDIILGALNLEGAYPDFIPVNLYQSLKHMEKVAFEDGAASEPTYVNAVIPFLYFGKVQTFRVIGTDEGFIHRPVEKDNPKLSDGQWFQAPGEVVIGARVRDTLRLKIGDSLQVTPWTTQTATEKNIDPFPMKIAGILASQSSSIDRGIYANFKDGQEIIGLWQRQQSPSLQEASIWKSNVLNYFLVYLKPGGMEKLSNVINKRTVAQVVQVQDEVEKLHQLTGTGRKLGVFMTGLILMLSWLAVAAMMITRFDAMQMQIAVLRALGYSRHALRNWLIWEGLILGVGASLIGALFDAVVFPWVRGELGPSLPAESIVASSLLNSAPIWICTVIATVFAVFMPLAMIYRKDVHRSLKGM